jgi:hypothetical protein
MFPFISEAVIEQTAEHLGDQEGAILRALSDLENKEPAIAAYLFSEDTEALTRDEREWLLFVALVIFRAAEKTASLPAVSEDALIGAEERNWELLENATAQSFRARMDVFFKSTPQEDLLAFIEDSLSEDEEDNFITKEGREPMFVILKTIADVLTA